MFYNPIGWINQKCQTEIIWFNVIVDLHILYLRHVETIQGAFNISGMVLIGKYQKKNDIGCRLMLFAGLRISVLKSVVAEIPIWLDHGAVACCKMPGPVTWMCIPQWRKIECVTTQHRVRVSAGFISVEDPHFWDGSVPTNPNKVLWFCWDSQASGLLRVV